jgi:hypothetical protein
VTWKTLSKPRPVISSANDSVRKGMAVATNIEPARIANSFSPSVNGESVSAAPKNAYANAAAVKGTAAVLVTRVISTSVGSNPIRATSAGAAIIGEATACSMSPKNRSGGWSVARTLY